MFERKVLFVALWPKYSREAPLLHAWRSHELQIVLAFSGIFPMGLCKFEKV